MLVSIKREIFDACEYNELGWTCIEPIIMQVRGRDQEIKSQAYRQLTKGQQALFMFYVYYNHASKSLEEFQWWSMYFLKQSTWQEIKKAMVYFGDYNMLQLLEEVESTFITKYEKANFDVKDISDDDIADYLEHQISIKRTYKMLHEIAGITLELIGISIINNPGEFVQLVD